MQVNLDTQKYGNSVNFGKLKKVYGGKLLYNLIGNNGFEIEKNIIDNLKATDAFNKLCNKYNVSVYILPYASPKFGPLIMRKELHLKIFAKEISKGLFGFLKKKEQMPVASCVAKGREARTWDLSESIINNFIKPKDGLTSNINDFLKR